MKADIVREKKPGIMVLYPEGNAILQDYNATIHSTVIRALTGAVQYTKFIFRPDLNVPSGHMYCPDICTVLADVACLAVTC